MKQANISFSKGIHRTPSIGDSGELSECVNVIPVGGELQALEVPSYTGEYMPSSEYTLLHIHESKVGSIFRNLIAYYYDEGTDGEVTSYVAYVKMSNGSSTGTKICDVYDKPTISSIGNVLIISQEGYPIQYFLYENEAYTEVGYRDFHLDLAFGVQCTYKELVDKADAIELLPTKKDMDVVTGRFQGLQSGSLNGETSAGTILTVDIQKGHTYRLTVTITDPDTSKPKLWNFMFITSSGKMETEQRFFPSGLDYDFIAPANYSGIRIITGPNVVIGLTMAMSGTYSLSHWISDTEPEIERDKYKLNDTQDNINAYHGYINKFISEAKKRKEFVHPFFVRYAVKLVTGNYAFVSAPILIEPNTGVAPFMGVKFDSSKTYKDAFKVEAVVGAYTGVLRYRAYDSTQLSKLQALSSLVDSVVIGISSPIVQYDQNQGLDTDSYYIVGTKPTSECYGINASTGGLPGMGYTDYVHTPAKETPYDELLLEASNFHVIKEIKIADVSTSLTNVTLETGALEGLEGNMDLIPDDVLNLKKLSAESIFAYNNRLTLAGVRERLFEGYGGGSMNGIITSTSSTMTNVFARVTKYGNDYKSCTGILSCPNTSGRWFYYPDMDASALDVRYGMSSAVRKHLKRHPFLNGSYWFYGGRETALSVDTSINSPRYGEMVDKGGLLVTSRVNDPFSMETEQSIACGKIYAISSAAKALSQGQFGQFPLYVFAEDGIWAMSVGNDGRYEAKQPISREVISVKSSVTQLDDSVAFITAEGVKIISGSSVQLISESVHGLNVNESFIKAALDFKSGSGTTSKGTGKVPARPTKYNEIYIFDTADFLTQIQVEGTRICYEYANQLLHILVPSLNWHYVYSRKTKEWSKQFLWNYDNLKSYVQAYPASIVQLGTDLYEYNGEKSNGQTLFYALTRSFTAGDPFTRKVLHDLRVFGQFTAGHEKWVAVYASEDNENWKPLTSLKVRSAKYYRFLVFGKLQPGNTLTGLTLHYEERFGHKFR